MFDIGFSELIVIGIVALVVIGPERLPKVARTAGLLLGRMQRYVNEIKADIAREMQLEELKKLQSDARQSVRDFERGVADEMRAIEQSVERTVGSIEADIRPSAPSDVVSDAPASGEPPRDGPPPAAKE
ncbi:MAG: Sec-independent protein translocase protein TatB [Candidatus Accumulibacter sp.]|jgi:sec-independent protein translocase protein TatB|nr:Sec-independent protein translocase protein TatB [Accumulibacter sp.]